MPPGDQRAALAREAERARGQSRLHQAGRDVVAGGQPAEAAAASPGMTPGPVSPATHRHPGGSPSAAITAAVSAPSPSRRASSEISRPPCSR